MSYNAPIIIVPGVAEPTWEPAMFVTPEGFIQHGLEALYLFKETSGTTIVDELGGLPGIIDEVSADAANAYERLLKVRLLSIDDAGSGGTDGTFALGFSGGGGTGAAGTFTVTGGAVTAVALTSAGAGYTSAPTVSLSASDDLTGATVAAVMIGTGVKLSARKTISLPAFDMASAWTLWTGYRTVGDFGGTGEKVGAVMGTRSFPVRGTNLYQRGTNDFDVAQTTGRFIHAPSNGAGAVGTVEDLSPSGIAVAQTKYLAAHSFNGSNLITSHIYGNGGTLIAADSMTVTLAQLFTVSGVTTSVLQWVLGGVNANYAAGITEYDFAMRTSRTLTDYSPEEIMQQCTAAM